MAVTAYWFGKAFLAMLNKEVDYDTDAIKVTLHTSAFTPNQDTMDYFDDCTNELPTAGGYTAGGATLGTKTIGYTAGTNVIKLDAADTVWTSSTLTARYAVVRCAATGVAGTEPLLGYIDFGEDKVSSAGDFTITWNAAGIATITVA